MSREYSKEERLERACLRMALNIRSLWEEKGSSDTRLLNPPLIDNKLIIVGRSKSITGKIHYEHVVPRIMIVNQCHQMIVDGQSNDSIAAFIRDHLKIVVVSPEEAERLDRIKHFGLKQTMPVNWTFGGDIFARLTHAGVEWEAES